MRHKNLLEKFYTAFEYLDAEEMAACYHDEVIFEDPAFGMLKGNKAKNMWRMLCASQQGRNFRLTYSDVRVEDGIGYVHWEAEYVFSQTKRAVHNIIEARFEFKDGLIIKHTDHFDLYRWAKQALGPIGFLLGWTGGFQKKLNEQTNLLLEKFERKNGL